MSTPIERLVSAIVIRYSSSSDRPAPFSKHTDTWIAIMLGPGQMPTELEQILNLFITHY